MNDLVDTTEMYLRTLYELQEEGVPPLRARIAERLHQSGPTVSQTVARMERDGLLVVNSDRHVELTEEGTRQATAVMRKHRLAERLLVDVLGLEWSEVHEEACRWEHVMSEAVERRIVALLGAPGRSPYGNPIPGLESLEQSGTAAPPQEAPTSTPGTALAACVDDSSRTFRLLAIGEHLQKDVPLMGELQAARLIPGAVATAQQLEDDGLDVRVSGGRLRLPMEAAAHLFVTPA